MSYGFLALNNANQVLVSSDTRNLHFVQKIASPTELLYQTNNYGGTRRWRYRATCSVTPVPFITFPSGEFYGISRVTNAGGGQWDIEVIRSGTSGTTPEMYIFADPRASTATDAYGMLVYRDDGTPSFDSRLRPLAVTGGLAVTHPSNPRSPSGGLDAHNCSTGEAGSGGVFYPTEFNNYGLGGQAAKPMFSFASLAQAQRQATYNANSSSCAGFDIKGNCVGGQTNQNWSSTYWCFYRGGIKFDGASTISAGWIAVSFGCNWTYQENSAFLGIGTGSSSGQGGTWPYTNETINLTSNSLIAGDAARYD